ncbi:mannose-P-dolichol utilization defect 1 protein homolog, partial [Mercenaria mercenaria]|uniref:mannose-P-dolichol utilization defect 1 protein homolog n=1 Tax=Mercenaria mercenaria TaxID=6596 RepID=UPI00234F8A75
LWFISVKLPQILKIIKGKSGEGISFFGQLFELIGISANASYGFQHAFPFSSYGEGIFLGLQTSAVLFLVLFYAGNILGSFLFIAVYGGIMAYLLSPMVPMKLLAAIQTVNIAVVMAGKLLQALANYRNSSTGQLSVITVGLIFGGSIARIFTSLQETGDQLVVITYICAASCNAVLVGQMIYYWNKKKQD